MSAQFVESDMVPATGAVALGDGGLGASAAGIDPPLPLHGRRTPYLVERLLVRYCGQDLYVRPCRRGDLVVAGALALLAVASFYLLDAWLAATIKALGIDALARQHQTPLLVVRWPGHLVFALLVAGALWLWHPWRLQAAVMTLWAVFFSGSNWILKWVLGRYRPHRGRATDEFNFFAGGPEGLFLERNLSLPSGDVSLAFALAAALAWMMPRGRWAFFGWAALVAIQRLSENAHHASDVLAGAALGLVSFHLGHFAGSVLGEMTARRIGVEPPASPPAAHDRQ